MEIFVLIEQSSGEERLSLDNVAAFTSFEMASKALKESHDNIITDIMDYGDITQDELDTDYYSVILEENDFETIYEGHIKILEVN